MTTPWRTRNQPAYLGQEKREAKKKGARPQLNSGRVWSGLRDVVQNTVIGRLLIDCKTGAKGPLKSYRVTEKEWRQFHRDANRTPPGCHPVLKVDIGPYRLVTIEDTLWDEILEELDGKGSPP